MTFALAIGIGYGVALAFTVLRAGDVNSMWESHKLREENRLGEARALAAGNHFYCPKVREW